MNAVTARTRPTRPRRAPWMIAGAALLALGTAVLGAGAVHVYTTRPPQVAVQEGAGVANFNFRVTGIPVPGVVPGVRVQARWRPAALSSTTATVTLNLKALDTGIALRDEHARTFLGVPAHPTATFRLGALEGAARVAPGQVAHVTARGVLTLNGVSRDVRAPTTLTLNSAGTTLDVKAEFGVTFADHGISIPGADPTTDVQVRFRLPVTP